VNEISQDSDPRAMKIQIYTLGQFAIHIDGRPLQYGRKAPKKPLELLKALIAFGGASVDVNTLLGAVWPELGRAARASFDVALMRLRKLLGHPSAVLLDGGRVSLNVELCCVDVWTFEQSTRQFDAEPRPSGARLAMLYPGRFLEHDGNQFWIENARDRLASRYREFALRLAQAHERSGDWQLAAQIYRLALNHDPLTEEFYYGLMACELRLGRHAEAIKTYRRCRQLLSINLQTRPSTALERLHQSALRSEGGSASSFEARILGTSIPRPIDSLDLANFADAIAGPQLAAL
jgi:LuxR family transcriptional regulator, maltose regulon positive regulatory protein